MLANTLGYSKQGSQLKVAIMMEPALNFANTPLDLQITIGTYLLPSDILALRKVYHHSSITYVQHLVDLHIISMTIMGVSLNDRIVVAASDHSITVISPVYCVSRVLLFARYLYLICGFSLLSSVRLRIKKNIDMALEVTSKSGNRIFPPLYVQTGDISKDRLAFIHVLERLKVKADLLFFFFYSQVNNRVLRVWLGAEKNRMG